MKRVVHFALGMATGTLLYTRFLGDAHQLDWGRAALIGIFVGLAGIIYALVWPQKSHK